MLQRKCYLLSSQQQYGVNSGRVSMLNSSDNMAVVAALSARSARHPIMSHLIKCLFFWEARYNFEYSAEHLAGKRNSAADALSRDHVSLFFSLTPQAMAAPTAIPPQVVSLLLDSNLHWTSPTWVSRFRDSLNRV